MPFTLKNADEGKDPDEEGMMLVRVRYANSLLLSTAERTL